MPPYHSSVGLPGLPCRVLAFGGFRVSETPGAKTWPHEKPGNGDVEYEFICKGCVHLPV